MIQTFSFLITHEQKFGWTINMFLFSINILDTKINSFCTRNVFKKWLYIKSIHNIVFKFFRKSNQIFYSIFNSGYWFNQLIKGLCQLVSRRVYFRQKWMKIRNSILQVLGILQSP